VIIFLGKKITTLSVLFTQCARDIAYSYPKHVKVRELTITEKDRIVNAAFHLSWGIEFDRMKIVMK